jgi:16S rRNA (uracil1498-N3)-methyltransferase
MQLPRFYLAKQNIIRQRFFINDADICHQLRQIWRKDTGAAIILFDGEGSEYEAEIRFLTKEQVSGVIVKQKPMIEEWPYIVLAQAMPKAGKADSIVRMCTEVGVRGFVFFESEYSIPKIKNYDQQKIERLERVAIEAGRQSERGFLPIINKPMSFAEVMKTEASIKIMLHSRTHESSESILSIAKKLTANDTVLLVVGPEGGFSPKEVEFAVKNKTKIGYLNMPILRTETAGVVASGILVSALNK